METRTTKPETLSPQDAGLSPFVAGLKKLQDAGGLAGILSLANRDKVREANRASRAKRAQLWAGARI